MALDTTDLETPAEALAALGALVPVIQDEAAALDRPGAFPDAALGRLRDAGVLARFGGDAPAPLELLQALRLVGRANLSLGRLFEGHVNAARLIARRGDKAQRAALADDLRLGRMLGVWNTEPSAGARIVAGAGGPLLAGAKSYASGAGRIDRAIVTALTAAGERQMVIVDADQPGRADLSTWPVSGMKATGSGLYDLAGLAAGAGALLGAPGDYEREPQFTAGAWRFTAVQLGGIERILGLLRGHLQAGAGGRDPVHRARFGLALAGARSAGLWVRQAAVRAEAPGAGSDEIAFVLMTRGVVERAGLEVIEAAQRSIGTRAFFDDGPVDMACRDLALYLRQPAPDEALDRAATAFLEADAWRDDPLW